MCLHMYEKKRKASKQKNTVGGVPISNRKIVEWKNRYYQNTNTRPLTFQACYKHVKKVVG